MKKAILTVSIGLVIAAGCRSHFDTTKERFTVSTNPEMLARGKNLSLVICGQCHLDAASNTFIGAPMLDIPSALGKVYARNLTADSHAGIGQYTDAELFYLIRTGVARDGRFIPFMVRPNMSDDDLKAIIAYLRSGDAPVAAKDTTVGVTHYSLIGKMAFQAAGKALPYKTGVNKPAESDKVATGRYLVDQIGCYHCHSQNIAKVNYLEPEKTKGYMQGGMKTEDPNGEKLYVPNLTPDNETGIGKYTLEEFSRALKQGIGRDNKILRYPMRMYGDMTDDQVEAIYDYLKSLPPVHHEVKKSS